MIDQAEKLTWVQLDAPLRVIKVPRGKQDDSDGNGSDDDSKSNTGCSFDLAYGLSVHKSQGSEFPIVIIGLDDSPAARMVCSRNWIYTGISRAKKVCLLVGKRLTADGFCRVEAVKPRVTFLTDEIRERMNQK